MSPDPRQARPVSLSHFFDASLALEMALLMGLTLFLPFIVHLLPVWGDDNWGKRLLPIFIGPLVAGLFYRWPVGVGLAVVVPWLNHLLTGRPVAPMALLISVQLTVFVLCIRGLIQQLGKRWFFGPLAYGFSAMAGTVLLAIWPHLLPVPPLSFLIEAVLVSWPGIVILGTVNWLVLHYYPPRAA